MGQHWPDLLQSSRGALGDLGHLDQFNTKADFLEWERGRRKDPFMLIVSVGSVFLGIRSAHCECQCRNWE